MSIVSTTVTADAHTQRDGRRDVAELHVFASGESVTVMYRAEPGMDTAAIAEARKATLEAQAAEREAAEILNG